VAERKSFLMRIDPALWRELERWAADDLRSINGQIEFILRDALRRRGVTPAPLTESPLDDENGGEKGR
jgi:hypothetical protein